MLRDGIEESEKIRMVRAKGPEPKELKDALASFDIRIAKKSDAATLNALVLRARRAGEDCARAMK